MNVKRLRQLADHIESLPTGAYDQTRYLHFCGSPACIAGHAVALFGSGRLPERIGLYSGLACDLLDLDDDKGDALFSAFPPLGRDARPDDAARVLRHLAATGDVVWEEVR